MLQRDADDDGGLTRQDWITGVDVSGVSMLAVVREIQVPLLAVLLIGGCAAKARQALRSSKGSGPTAMFPLWLRRPQARWSK